MNIQRRDDPAAPSRAAVRRILFASLVGTAIEFFDFYIYATAAVLVFPTLFFPAQDPTSAMLQSLATFSLAFFARPIGSALFGHFGDRIGRKATLVTALLTMGGVDGAHRPAADLRIHRRRRARAAGAVPLRAGPRARRGMGRRGAARDRKCASRQARLVRQLSAAGRAHWASSFERSVPATSAPGWSRAQLLSFGWRLPFLASAIMVLVGLYVRLQLVETPEFRRASSRASGSGCRFSRCSRTSAGSALGTLGASTTFVVFYLMTVFALNWATTAQSFARADYLESCRCSACCSSRLTIPVSARLADRIGGRRTLIIATSASIAFGFAFGAAVRQPRLRRHRGVPGARLSLTGFTYGPLGSVLAALFPTAVRYTGTSLSFNFAGIIGASLAPYIANRLAPDYGVGFVGLYLSAAGVLSLAALSDARGARRPPRRSRRRKSASLTAGRRLPVRGRIYPN